MSTLNLMTQCSGKPISQKEKLTLITWVEHLADHAWDDEEDEGQNLQISCQYDTRLGVGHALSRQ